MIVVLLSGCTVTKNYYTTTQEIKTDDGLITNGKLYSSLFIQRAAEYKALCFQAYNTATDRLEEITKNNRYTKPLAVVTDIDETVLDNSPNSVHQAFAGKDFEPKAWEEWTIRADADTISGAKTFFDFAKSKGVEVFYVTNRNENERAATLKNLQRFNFPFADDEHLLLRTTTSGKAERRSKISQTHEIVLLCGDNLSDFSEMFDKNTEEKRTTGVRNNAALFGNKFIVLPNPNYGDWESSIFEYNHQLTPKQKAEIIRTKLKTY